MSVDLLKNEIKESKSGRFYLFCGSEEYSKNHYVSELRKRVNSLPLPEFNYICLKGKAFSAAILRDCLDSFPYMSDYKLIEINDIDLNKLSESSAEELCEALNDIPDYANVLIVAREDELFSKAIQGKEKSPASKVVQSAHKNGLLVEFKSESGAKVAAWVKKHFAARKCKIESGAVEELLLVCGDDLYSLLGEIEKLCAYCAGRAVTVSDVSKICCLNQSFQVFDLTRALTDRDTASIHKIFGRLIDSGQPAQLIIGVLSKCISDMLIIKAGIDESVSVGEIAAKIKSFDWAVRRYLPAVNKASYEYLEYAAKECAACERSLKSYSADEATAIELFLLRLSCRE